MPSAIYRRNAKKMKAKMAGIGADWRRLIINTKAKWRQGNRTWMKCSIAWPKSKRTTNNIWQQRINDYQ